MIHSKEEILKKYCDFCDTELPDDISLEDIDKMNAICAACPVHWFCVNHTKNIRGGTIEEYERLEEFLIKRGFFKDEELAFSHKEIFDALNGYCESVPASCNGCYFKDLCNAMPVLWPGWYKDSRHTSLLKKIENGLIEIGWIGTKQKGEVSFTPLFSIDESIKDITIEKETNENNDYESVNGPSHYDGTKCIEEMRKLFGDEAVRGFCACNWYKYNYRAGKKPGVDVEQDKAKAEWYKNYAFENL